MELVLLELAAFRSYRDCRIEPDEEINVLVGPNGAGKTNFLEAIWYLSTLRSFRRVSDDVLIQEDANEFLLRAQIRRSSGSSELGVVTPRHGRRQLEVNGKRVRGRRDLAGQLSAVLFFPDDLDVVKRGPSGRREFIDEVAAQLWPAAAGEQGEYTRTLRQRNSLLRQSGRDTDGATLDVWDSRLSQAGGMVMARRAEAIDMLTGALSPIYGRLSGSQTSIVPEYRSGWNPEPSKSDPDELSGWLAEALVGARSADKERRVSTVGPHRDDPGWLMDGHDTRTHLSQGEQRSLALSLRLAARHAIVDQRGESPVLLLDDVFSELDLKRAEALANVLPEGQTFITTTREEEVPFAGRRWVVERGVIQ